jgi:hypothetical protein
MNDFLKKRQEYILAGRPLTQKDKKPIAKKSAKRIAKEAEEKLRRGDGDTELQKFFKAAMKRMTGHCLECSAKTETHIYKYAIFSICHILDKREGKCPSVKTHPQNWIELCPDHHTRFDSLNWDEREKLGYWPEIFQKLIVVANDLAPEEYRHLPDSVKKYMEETYPFPEGNPYKRNKP